jgi:hypothetical protein
MIDIESSKGVIIMDKLKGRRSGGKTKKNNRTNSDLQNTAQKTKDQATRASPKTSSALQFIHYDYPFGILKLFLSNKLLK